MRGLQHIPIVRKANERRREFQSRRLTRLFTALTGWVVWVIYRREFRSRLLRTLAPLDDGAGLREAERWWPGA